MRCARIRHRQLDANTLPEGMAVAGRMERMASDDDARGQPFETFQSVSVTRC